MKDNNYIDNLWNEAVTGVTGRIVNKEIKQSIRKAIKEMFKKHGIEYSEERIKETLTPNPKLQKLYMIEYQNIIKYSV